MAKPLAAADDHLAPLYPGFCFLLHLSQYVAQVRQASNDLARPNIGLGKQKMLATRGLPTDQAVALHPSSPLASLRSTHPDTAS